MTFENTFQRGKKQPDSAELQSRTQVVEMARQLGAGQYGSLACPECGGGSSKERSMSMLVEQNGVIKFNCHRAACGFAGQAYTSPGTVSHPAPQPAAVSRLNPLNADLNALSEKELEYFEKRFHISADTARNNIRRAGHRYAVSIHAPDNGVRGWITRRPWSDSPADTAASRADSEYAVKVLTYMEKDEPVMSWYKTPVEDYDAGDIYLVEDQLSAMRLVEYFTEGEQAACRVAALLGTGLNAQKVAEIQQVAGRSAVHFCFDADATGHAFAMARKWGQAFTRCHVIVLSKDIKDSTDAELDALPL